MSSQSKEEKSKKTENCAVVASNFAENGDDKGLYENAPVADEGAAARYEREGTEGEQESFLGVLKEFYQLKLVIIFCA